MSEKLPPVPAPPATIAHLLLAACAVIWGTTFVATKVLTARFDAVEIVGLRFAIGLPLLYALVRWRGIPLAFEPRDRGRLAAGAAILLYHFLVQAHALRTATATHTAWIITVSPLVIAALSFALLGERFDRWATGGILCATIGVVLLISEGRPTALVRPSSVGDWLALSTTASWALYTIVTRDLSRRVSPLAVTLVVFVPLLVAGLVRLALHTDLRALASLPAPVVASILFLGTLGTLAQWFWQIGVARIGAARAGVYLYLEPASTTLLGVSLLGERYGAWAIAGSALILTGVIIAQRRAAS